MLASTVGVSLIVMHGAWEGAAQGTSVAPDLDSTSTNAVVQLSQITVIGSAEAALDLPASGAYIEAEELQKYGFTDVNRALRQVPGVYVREEDGFGLFPNISVRGVTTERSKSVTIMEDGILSAPAPYSAPSAYYIPNVGRMSGLEVLKGSSQIKYGPHITGGAVNYLSTPIPDSRQSYINFSVGSYNELKTHLWSGDVINMEDRGVFGYLIEGYAHRSDGFKTIDTTPDFSQGDETGFTRMEPMVKVFWELPTEIYQRLEWKYGYSDLEADETYLGLTDADFEMDPARRYSASRFDNIQTQNHRATMRYIVEPNDFLRFETVGYLQRFGRNWEKLASLRGPNLGLSAAILDTTPGGGLDVLRGAAAGTLRVRNNNRDYRIYGVQSTVGARFDTGSVAHDAEVGVRFHFDEVDRFQWDIDYEQDANGVIVGQSMGALGAAGDRIQQSRAVAVHLKDELSWGRWTLTPGARFETVDQEYEQDFRREDGGGSPASGDGRLNAAAGGASIAYEISDGWKAFFGAHRGFSIPAPRASIRDDLEEETSLSYELGTRYSNASAAFMAEAILFQTDFSDLIVGGNLAGGGTEVTENVGDIQSRGLELALQYDPGLANGWSVRTPMRLSLTLTDAELDGAARNTDPESLFEGGRDGASVPYVPEYQLSGEIGVETDRIGGYLSFTYVPGTYTTASNSRAPFRDDGTGTQIPDARVGRTDPYLVTDLTLRYEVRSNMTLNFGVRNLFDRQYVASRHPHGPRPGLPRTFSGGAEWRF